MSFLRHREIYQVSQQRDSEFLFERARPNGHAPSHRLDESPIGYSWRVALQQSPLPLHQPKLTLRQPAANFNQRLAGGYGTKLKCGLTGESHAKRLPRRAALILSPTRAGQLIAVGRRL
jgi:hypothetical protein